MKDEVLKFKNFLYRERKSSEERIELLRDLEGLLNWGRIEPVWENGVITKVKVNIEIRFEKG